MFGSLTAALFAQNPAAAPAAQDATSGLLVFAPYLLVIGLWFYLLLIRPQQKQERARRELIASVRKNDRVLTTSGIYATVVSVDPDADRLVLRIDDDRGVKVTFSKASVATILDSPDDKDRDKDKEKGKGKSAQAV